MIRIMWRVISMFMLILRIAVKRSVCELDKELLIAYDKCLREMAEILNIEYDIELDDLSRLPDVLLVEEKEEDIERSGQWYSKASGHS